LAILEDMKGKGAHIFSGARAGKPLSDMALLMTLRRMGRGDLTTHGFRSTFRDWSGDETEFPREVAEAALAHAVGDKAEQSYRRNDALEKRRRLMDAWAAYCEQKPAADNAANHDAVVRGGG
jgi:integrase